jgi:hypothetical protein
LLIFRQNEVGVSFSVEESRHFADSICQKVGSTFVKASCQGKAGVTVFLTASGAGSNHLPHKSAPTCQ